MKKYYPLEFKTKVAKEAIKSSCKSEIARQYHLSSIIVYRWIREFKEGKFNRHY
ncbi:helix-turn-helix domain-containing protein [Aneurinibacillus tyrosinisolvens]|uniref:helix-turn-helix domain-containing protein n=1 Tax=Aneurinibacillus tyrosinisolvens TaxID=1443435 RepID=UPI000AAAE4D7|nr:helix-turn-helix domain-containing protein [Aneurinibacillus tyrosinisolvens]